jgi:hypothetical protein
MDPADPDPVQKSHPDPQHWLKYITIFSQEEAGLLEFFSLGEGQLWIDFTPALEAKDELTCLYLLGTGFLV